MKKLILSLILILLSLTLILTSCGSSGDSGENGGEGGGGGETPVDENFIWNKTSELYVIFGEGVNGSLANNIATELDYNRGATVKYAPADSSSHKHEIVVGDTDREITEKAYSKLSRVDKDKEDDKVILVYSDGSSLALIFEADDEGIVENLAIEYFLEEFVGEELTMTAGSYKYKTVDLIEDYYAPLDSEYKAEKWAELEEAVGKELADAYKQLYAIYSPDCVTWLANLYDPDICVCVDFFGEEECAGRKYCGTGGFYYSNSGRDTMGFLPDAESTTQALSFLSSAGLAYRYNNHYPNIVPEDMKEAISSFLISLQEPNGFFYHPQWGIEYTDARLSRRARDLNWCTNVLTAFGRKPIYKTPNGIEGSGDIGVSASPYGLTTRLGVSSVIAVSSAVEANEYTGAEHLLSVETFKEYLSGLDIRNNSYFVGNELTSQSKQIIARDSELAKLDPDNPTPLMDTLIEWLNENQNPETGHWDYKKPSDEGYSAYYGTNGLLKISGIYVSAGVVIPHAREAAKSAMVAITAEQEVGTVVELYNTWFAIQTIIQNIRSCGDAEDNETADAIVAELREIAPSAVLVSRDKISLFLKPDGSASYGLKYSSYLSQGCPVAVQNTEEGDVNATTIAVTGIINHSLGALELLEYKIPIFGEVERYTFFKTIDELSPIYKNDDTSVPDQVTFDDEEIGEESVYLTANHLKGHGTSVVVSDPTGADKGNVVELISYAGSGDYLKLSNETVAGNANTSVLEGDFYLESSSSSYCVQLLMENVYLLTFRTEGDLIHIVESSSTDGSVAFERNLKIPTKMKQWFRLRVEYYYGDHDSVRIKVYADADLSDGVDMKLYAVTDNYYDSHGVKFYEGVGTPTSQYVGMSLYAMSGVNLKMYLDNLNVYKTKDAYVAESDPDNQPPINVDTPDKESIVYNFDETDSYPELIFNDAKGAFSVKDGSLSLSYKGEEVSLSVPTNLRRAGAECVKADFDILVNDAKVGDTVFNLRGRDVYADVFGFNLVLREDTEGKYLALVPVGETVGEDVSGVRIPLGEKIGLSFAFYHGEDTALIYVNGKFVGASDILYKGGVGRFVESFAFFATGENEFELSLDNISVETLVSDFESAVSSGNGRHIFDFEEEDVTVELSSNATLKSYADGKRVEINSTKAASYIRLPVNDRSEICTASIIELTLAYTTPADSGVMHTLNFEDKDGNVIASVALVAKGGSIDICQVGRDGVLLAPLYTFSIGKAAKIKVELFSAEGLLRVYFDEALVGCTTVISGAEYLGNRAAFVSVRSDKAKSVLTLDKVICENLYSIYHEKTAEGVKNPETDLSIGLDFESSSNGSLPEFITHRLLSAASSLSVDRVNRDDGYTNVLSFKTGTGNNDTLSFTASDEKLSGHSGAFFEADIKLDYTSGNPTHRIIFSDKTGNTVLYMLQFRVKSGEITLTDNSHTDNSLGKNNDLALGIAEGEWFKLRVEFYKGNKDTVRFKVFVDGELKAVSDNFAGSESSSATPPTLFERVEFYTLLATDATLSLDNVKLGGLDGSCKDAVTTE